MAIHERNQILKERVLDSPYEICIERARYYTRSYRQTEGEHPALRAAKAFAETSRNISLCVDEHEQLAGRRTSKTLGVAIPVERGDLNLVLELEGAVLFQRERRPFHISPEDRRELYSEILPYWRGKTVRERKRTRLKVERLIAFPALGPLSFARRARGLDLHRIWRACSAPGMRCGNALREAREILYNSPALVSNVFDTQGHLILGHRTVLREGFCGIQTRAAQRRIQAVAENDSEGTAFLDSVILCCEAMRVLAERYAEEAVHRAAACNDRTRRAELEAIAARCRRVPYHPPRDFREAVQAVWLTHIGSYIAYGMGGILTAGRLDQLLFPYYKADRREGLLSEEEAAELLEELLIKLSCGLLALPQLGKNTGSELGSDSCAVTIGGVTPEGEDGVNALSFLLLDAFTNVKSLGNSFAIRLSRKNPEPFWKRAIETHRHTSGAALFADETVIQALENCEVAEADARNYGIIGCVEPTSEGDTFGCTSGNDVSLTAALEMALLNGHSRLMGKRIGPATGDPCRFADFPAFMDAFKRQLGAMITLVVRIVNIKDDIYRAHFPNPLISAALSGCVEQARDMTAGGARYNFASIGGRGFGTTVNSLLAIKHFVYDQSEIPMAALLRALAVNFKGYEPLRARLATQAPKYGCGDGQSDAIAREVAAFFCAEVARQDAIRGGSYRPGFFSYGMHVLEGLFLGATPDGRRAGEPVSNSFSPANGSEREGPTGLFRSVAAIDHSLISNGCALNVKLFPALFEEERGRDLLTSLIRTYFSMGGMEVQINAISNETLRDAQRYPERYRDLVVRVSGYSAYFTDLGPALQEEIIARTEFRSGG